MGEPVNNSKLDDSPEPAPEPAHGLARYAAWRARFLARPLWAIAAVSIALALLWFGAYAFVTIDMTFPEGALVIRALEVAHGQAPYHDWHAWPHAFAPYAPLTYYLPGWTLRVLGFVHSGFLADVRHGYLVGRAWSLASIVLLVAVICWGVRRGGGAWPWGIPAAAFALRWQDVWGYCSSYRPDAPRTLLTVVAVVLLLGAAPSRRRVWLGFGALWLSFWFKPTAFGVLLALLLWLAWTQGRKRAALVAAVFGGAGLALFALLDWHWHGLLRMNLIDSLRNGIDLGFLRREFGNLFLPDVAHPAMWLIYPASLAALYYACAARRDASLQTMLPLFFSLPLSLLNALAQGLKAGADRNYFLEPVALAALLLGWWLARIWQARPRRGVPLLLRECFLAIAMLWWTQEVIYQAWLFPMQLHHVRLTYTPTPVMRLAATLPGPVLATNSFLNIVSPNRETLLDRYQYSNLVGRGFLDSAPLRTRIERREFSALILNDVKIPHGPAAPTWDFLFFPGMGDLIERNYFESAEYGIFRVWLPRPR